MKFKLIKRKMSTLVRRQLKNKRKIFIIGLTVVLATGGTILTYKKVKNNKQEHIIVNEFKDDKLSEEIYLESVNILKSELVKTNKLSFCETQMRVSETFGYDKNDNITLEGVYDVAFTIEMNEVIKGISIKKNKIHVEIDREDIYLYKCEQVSDIAIVNKEESFMNKCKDVFKNDDADLLHKASNRLNVVAKEEANKTITESELRTMAEESLRATIGAIINTNVEIKINDNVGGK